MTGRAALLLTKLAACARMCRPETADRLLRAAPPTELACKMAVAATRTLHTSCAAPLLASPTGSENATLDDLAAQSQSQDAQFTAADNAGAGTGELRADGYGNREAAQVSQAVFRETALEPPANPSRSLDNAQLDAALRTGPPGTRYERLGVGQHAVQLAGRHQQPDLDFKRSVGLLDSLEDGEKKRCANTRLKRFTLVPPSERLRSYTLWPLAYLRAQSTPKDMPPKDSYLRAGSTRQRRGPRAASAPRQRSLLPPKPLTPLQGSPAPATRTGP